MKNCIEHLKKLDLFGLIKKVSEKNLTEDKDQPLMEKKKP